ncbi:MAG: tetratricopeptide repeat protein, partial [Bacteroidales bacterium]|nr:tetratricopeptide repeat protein [Bacteroidales bacterium]
MRKILIFVLLSGCVVIPTQQARQILDAAESRMNERPDSALVLLEGIDAGSLRTRNLHARHALLLTMALDKNYMDITE